jgi:hypothetical protein
MQQGELQNYYINYQDSCLPLLINAKYQSLSFGVDLFEAT